MHRVYGLFVYGVQYIDCLQRLAIFAKISISANLPLSRNYEDCHEKPSFSTIKLSKYSRKNSKFLEIVNRRFLFNQGTPQDRARMFVIGCVVKTFCN
jgi:hypothetical protein